MPSVPAHPSGPKVGFTVKLSPQHIAALRLRAQNKTHGSVSRYLTEIIEGFFEFQTLEKERTKS